MPSPPAWPLRSYPLSAPAAPGVLALRVTPEHSPGPPSSQHSWDSAGYWESQAQPHCLQWGLGTEPNRRGQNARMWYPTATRSSQRAQMSTVANLLLHIGIIYLTRLIAGTTAHGGSSCFLKQRGCGSPHAVVAPWGGETARTSAAWCYLCSCAHGPF